jgi:signal peptidase I
MTSATLGSSGSAKPRLWWAAFLFTFLGFGLGYLYVGRPNRALLALTSSFFGFVGSWTGLGGVLVQPVWQVLFLTVLIAAGLAFAIDAARLARAQPEYELRPYNRWWLYLGIVVASTTIGSLDLVPGSGVRLAIRTFSFPSGAMVPTLRVGERGIGDMRAYRDKDPERGDVALFVVQRQGGAEFVSRIIGMPGDRIQIKAGVLHINGQSVTEVRRGEIELDLGSGYKSKAVEWHETLPGGRSYFIYKINDGQGIFNNTAEHVVSAGHYFMMGDNRDNASDSRDMAFMGFVPREALRGRMAFIYWTKNWERMGRVVE